MVPAIPGEHRERVADRREVPAELGDNGVRLVAAAVEQPGDPALRQPLGRLQQGRDRTRAQQRHPR